MKTTILLPISRAKNIEIMMHQISVMNMMGCDVDILVIADSPLVNESNITEAMKEHSVNSKYKLIGVIKTDLPPVSENNIAQRRRRIADVFNLAKKHIPEDSDLVFCIEDDTLTNYDDFANLFASYNTFKSVKNSGIKVGIVSGVQVGRWGYRMIGAWIANDGKWAPKTEEIKSLETIPYVSNQMYSRVDATGFYCFIVEREAFVSSEFYASDFGPDVNFGLDLRRKGYVHFVDWSVRVGHMIPTGTLYPEKDTTVVVRYEYEDGKCKRVAP